ncbi:phosphoribosyltransferase [Gordonia rubripertincta]|uniref:Phosphoribosyltransferase family protein n=1 Tax=Gordonia rubripertincta TaxID=36822 RepID=A0ABT4MW07_GORRU|nr:phosphoribosyltransferase family protein [Gordonia rubripertincta]MCZ4551189.1 phosphoribosyltransferase family protein [Gordonia rubripertincta]
MRLRRDHGQRTFRNRDDAGQALARLLTSDHPELVRDPDVVVLGLARGGVPVAAPIADALHAPLDAFVIRKLGVPLREELAFGAVASGGRPLISDRTVRDFGLTPDDVSAVIEKESAELLRREAVYRQGRPPTPVADRVVILVDDGLATGSSMRAAVDSIRRRLPRQIIVAVGTGPTGTQIANADEIVCATIPPDFWAVGQSYRDFTQVTDTEVRDLLATE